MRVVCDTNILVRAAITPAGAAYDLLDLVARRHVLVTSIPVLAEVLEVLQRPRLQSLHGLDDAGMRGFVARLHELSLVVSLPPALSSIVVRDPKDDPIVFTAVAGKADVLCSLDRHLHHASVVEFCNQHGIRVCRDSELLAELRA